MQLPGSGDILREHLERPRCAGRLERPDATATVTNPACGDLLALDLAVEAGRIAAAGQVVQGCPAARALASILAGLVVGLSLEEAAGVDRERLDREAGGLPGQKKHAAHLAADALAGALRELRRVHPNT